MMKKTIVLARAAESDPMGRELAPLGDLQANLLTEAIQAKGLRFDRVLIAVHETDSWITAARVKEMTSEVGEKFLKELALREGYPCDDEILKLIGQYPSFPLATYAGQPGYQALCSHTAKALREIKTLISAEHNNILICSRHAHVLSSLALAWVSDMVFSGFKLCPSPHLPSFPIDRGDLCYGATEFFLGNGQALVFQYDASDPANQMVGAIQYLNPEYLAQSQPQR